MEENFQWNIIPKDVRSKSEIYRFYPIPEFWTLLHFLNEHVEKGGEFLELGTFLGNTAREVAYNRPDLNITTVDNFKFEPEEDTNCKRMVFVKEFLNGKMYDYETVKEFLEPYGINIIKSNVFQFFKYTNKKYDYIFVDAVKEYDKLIECLAECKQILNTNGIIACHDYEETEDTKLAIASSFFFDKNFELIGYDKKPYANGLILFKHIGV